MPRGATVRLLEWAFERLQREEARHHPRPEKIAHFEKLVSRLLDVSYAEERRSPRGNLLKVDVSQTKGGIWNNIKVRVTVHTRRKVPRLRRSLR
jgi:hypothetical protein